jgi:phospholipase C
VNHILFMIQENRSFDHYFGAMNAYRLKNIKDGTAITASDVDTLDSPNINSNPAEVAPNCTPGKGCVNPADQSAVVHWATSGAMTVTLNGSSAQANGVMSVTPSANTKYTIVATNLSGSTAASIVIGVTPAPGVGSSGSGLLVGASPETANPDQTVLLSWASGDGTPVKISPDPSPLPCGTPQAPFCYGPHATAPVKMPKTGSITYTFTSASGQTNSITLTQRAIEAPTASMSDSQQGHSSSTPALNVPSFRLQDQCVEDFSPDWLESHGAYNRDAPQSKEFLGNGFVHIAGGFAQYANTQPSDNFHNFHYFDVRGARAMGYFDETILPYYYYMAAQFATADRWFSPVPGNSPPNRLYEMGATSHGMVHAKNQGLNSDENPPIFKRIQDKGGISWKVYYSDIDPDTAGHPPNTTLLAFQPFAGSMMSHIAPVDCNKPTTPCSAGQTDYFTDLKNGTLPNVVLVEPGFDTGLDEHPGNTVQDGAAYVKRLIDALMDSSSWKDSVFFLTYDEAGGLYDHVKFAPAVSPDSFTPCAPSQDPTGKRRCDLIATFAGGKWTDKDAFTFCNQTDPNSPACVLFDHTGFRVPIFVASPFVKKHFVYHGVADNTAILTFIEKRYNLAPLTLRDKAQPDITDPQNGMFDFANVPWKTPPPLAERPAAQTNPLPACYLRRIY